MVVALRIYLISNGFKALMSAFGQACLITILSTEHHSNGVWSGYGLRWNGTLRNGKLCVNFKKISFNAKL